MSWPYYRGMVDRAMFLPPAKDYSLQETLARNVRQLVKHMGAGNVDRFAMVIGLAPETLRSVLAAKNDVRLSTLQQIANATGTKAERLLAEDYDAKRDTPSYGGGQKTGRRPPDRHLVAVEPLSPAASGALPSLRSANALSPKSGASQLIAVAPVTSEVPSSGRRARTPSTARRRQR